MISGMAFLYNLLHLVGAYYMYIFLISALKEFRI